MPRFSIITVCYNSIDKLEETIKSVLEQSYVDFEYIIVDGASSDGSLEVIKRYAFSDKRIKYISEPDGGLYDAMNKGIGLSSGDFIEFLNAGDELHDKDVLRDVDAFARKVRPAPNAAEGKNDVDREALQNKETINGGDTGDRKEQSDADGDSVIIYGNIVYMNPDGTEDLRIYGKSCGKAIYYATGDCVNHQACFAGRKCFEDAEGFRDREYRICADRDWMMRQTKRGTKWVNLDRKLVKYELSADSISVKDRAALKAEEKKCLKANFPAMYPIYCLFEGFRSNKALAAILHGVYKLLYIRR